MNSTVRIKFTCIHCNKKLSILAAGAGRTLSCPNPQCTKPITVPLPDANAAATPRASDLSANGAPSAAPTATSKHGAKWMVAAALCIVSLGAGLSFFLIKPHQNPKRLAVQASPHKAPTPVKALANGDQDEKATVNAAPTTRARTSQPNSPESQRKLAAAKKQQSEAAHKEQAARRERTRRLSEYATLAPLQSTEYYHNDQLIRPRWYRPPTEVTMARNLNLPRYDDDIPRLRKLLGSGNANVRDVSASIIKAHTLIEMYRHDVAFSTDNVMAEYTKALTTQESYRPPSSLLKSMGGQPVKTQGQVDRANMKRVVSVHDKYRQHQKANQAYTDVLDQLDQERKRMTYGLAKELAGAPPDKPVGIQISAEAFVLGEPVFHALAEDALSPSGRYCITLSNEDAMLTHCSLFVILRHLSAWRNPDDALARYGPPLGLDECTGAVLRTDASRPRADDVTFYYVGDFKTHEQVRVLGLQGRYVADKIESIGVVLFSDQMMVVGDPTPRFQELRDNAISQMTGNAGNQRRPQRNRR